jgi:transposase
VTMVAHTHPYVIGVDTHARSHAFAILAMPHGEVVEERQFPTTVAGITRAVQWVSRRTGGDLGPPPTVPSWLGMSPPSATRWSKQPG